MTPRTDYGLMRPVARIAQSVEQGIEPSLWLGLCFSAAGLSIELHLPKLGPSQR